jgi:hypothetical protein
MKLDQEALEKARDVFHASRLVVRPRDDDPFAEAILAYLTAAWNTRALPEERRRDVSDSENTPGTFATQAIWHGNLATPTPTALSAELKPLCVVAKCELLAKKSRL